MDEHKLIDSKKKLLRYGKNSLTFLAGVTIGVFAGWGLLMVIARMLMGERTDNPNVPNPETIVWIGLGVGLVVFLIGLMLLRQFKGSIVSYLICGVGFGMMGCPGYLGLIFLAWPRGC